MNKLIACAVMVVAVLLSLGLADAANTLVDQGKPGLQGAWPVVPMNGDGGTAPVVVVTPDGGVPVTIVDCVPGAFGQVEVATSATAIPAGGPTANRKSIIICNSSPSNEERCVCASNSSTVTVTSGLPLGAGGGCKSWSGATTCHCISKTAAQTDGGATNYQECL